MGRKLRCWVWILAWLGVSLLTAHTAQGSQFRFDPVHTQVFFCVSHLGFSRPCGRLHVADGFIRFDDGDWTQAAVEVNVDMASVDMGDSAWSEKIRSREFLETSHHPKAHFVSTKVEKTGDHRGVAHGVLDLIGVKRALDIDFTFNRAGVDAYSLKYTAGFSATAHLKRSDFGMQKYLPDIGDDIQVKIEVEGLRDRNAQEKSDADDKAQAK